MIGRGADALVASGCIGDELAAALKHEAHGRVQRGEFFGRIPYTSLIAHKPARSEGPEERDGERSGQSSRLRCGQREVRIRFPPSSSVIAGKREQPRSPS